ncbi:hypothetical protein CDD82_3129 [Ophiocordyceps australis]|uniref:Uncharacterized protein n=1 Tax=Ophiocordyceps australis TaxID=1399860 RepID=A0A2C5ZUS4_9HYPO|nr:hypothetical protein CDD82_3129 [Ophiocordyceps australis]
MKFNAIVFAASVGMAAAAIDPKKFDGEIEQEGSKICAKFDSNIDPAECKAAVKEAVDDQIDRETAAAEQGGEKFWNAVMSAVANAVRTTDDKWTAQNVFGVLPDNVKVLTAREAENGNKLHAVFVTGRLQSKLCGSNCVSPQQALETCNQAPGCGVCKPGVSKRGGGAASGNGTAVDLNGPKFETSPHIFCTPSDQASDKPAAGGSQKPSPPQGQEPIPDQSQEPIPDQGEEPFPDQGQEPIPEQGEESIPAQGEEPIPAQGQEPIPAQGEEPNPAQLIPSEDIR